MELYEKIPDEKIDVKIKMLESAFYGFLSSHKEGYIGEFGGFEEAYVYHYKYQYFIIGFQLVEVELLVDEEQKLRLEKLTPFKCLKCGRGVMHVKQNQYWCFGCGNVTEFTKK